VPAPARGQENVRKRYLIQVAAMNLGLVMFGLTGSGTPRQAADAQEGRSALLVAALATIQAILTIARSIRSAFGAAAELSSRLCDHRAASA
jgi:hypothetical protein